MNDYQLSSLVDLFLRETFKRNDGNVLHQWRGTIMSLLPVLPAFIITRIIKYSLRLILLPFPVSRTLTSPPSPLILLPPLPLGSLNVPEGIVGFWVTDEGV